MKFPSCTFLLVTSAAAVLSTADAFVPSSSAFTKRRVAAFSKEANAAAVVPRQQHLSSTCLGGAVSDATGLLKELEDFDEFDPDDDDDEEQTGKLLDVTIKALELIDGAKTSDLEKEVISENHVDEMAPVSRRPVITEYTDTEEEAEEEGEAPVTETAAKGESLFGGAITILKALRRQRIKRDAMGYTTYPRHAEFPDVDLSSAMKMMDGAPPLNQVFSPKKIVRVIRRALEAQIALGRLGGEDAADEAKTKEAAYQAYFTKAKLFKVLPNPLDLLPKPNYVVDHWEEDTEFARQFLAGVNPVMIEVAKKLDQLPDNMVEYLGKQALQDLADDKRLFFVSYDDIAELEVNPHQAYPLPYNEGKPQDQARYCYAPIVAFVLDKAREELDVLGIQLERTPDARVYTRNDSGKNEWLFVKSCVTTADSNMHEWVSHLGNTHLTMEPHIIAIYNTLRKAKHPLYTFLKPLCKDTLLLNWAARITLAKFGPNAFGDKQSSVGVGQFMQLIGKMWSRYSFFEKSGLPSELASRGFDEDFDMPNYLFREDGMNLWNAYGTFAKDFVDEIYDSDEDVASDTVVQEWAIETTDASRGAVPGFPTSFKDKDTVVRVLQTLMWITSGLHAAVNFPQYDYYGFVPNKPLGMRASLDSLPDKDSDIRSWMFESFFPHVSSGEEWLKMDVSLQATQTVHILTLPSNTCIDNLSDNFAKTGTKAYAKFQKNLDKISDGVNDRNKESKKAKKAVYSYLNPSVVPASIDI